MPFWLTVACAPPSEGEPSSSVDLVALVDPFIGTGGSGFSVGSGFPGAAWPFGLVKLGPDTADASGSAASFHRGGGYHADDVFIQGFSHLHHQGVGVGGHGAVAVMPVDGARGLDASSFVEEGYRAPFDEGSEHASPGRYAVQLTDPSVSVELAASIRTGLVELRFDPSVEEPVVLVDLGHQVGSGLTRGGELRILQGGQELEATIVADPELGGPYTLAIAARFEEAPISFGVWTLDDGVGQVVAAGTDAALDVQGDDVLDPVPRRLGAWFAFPQGSTVRLRTGLSHTDTHGSWLALYEEGEGFDVAAQQDDTRAAWADLVSRVEVSGGSDEDQVILASALYRMGLMPTLVSDVDGRFRDWTGEVRTADHDVYSDFSLWDTYRSYHPLVQLLWPEKQTDFLRSFARIAEGTGSLPVWPVAHTESGTMLGDPGAVVLGDALLRGLDLPQDEERFLLRTAVSVALGESVPLAGGRPDATLHETYGYYPVDSVGRSVAWDLELGIADALIARQAPGAGRPDAVPALEGRAAVWRAHYDPATGFMSGRDSAGGYFPPQSEQVWDELYAEGNARQYIWLVPHDPDGLFEAMGGRVAALERLTLTMEETAADEATRPDFAPNDWYWHGNEPALHMPWLGSWLDRPDLTRVWTHWLWDTYAGTGPDGVTGNDDGGAMSSWLVCAGIGLFPLVGTDQWLTGGTRFDRVVIHHGEGDLVIAPGASLLPSIDGTPFTGRIAHEDLVHASRLSLTR